VKRIDLHSHVIPEPIVQAMREQPDVYNTRIESAGHKRVFVRGKTRFVTDSPFDKGEEQPVERLEAVPGLTEKEREDVCCRSALALFGGEL
jgi:hypothetical protein